MKIPKRDNMGKRKAYIRTLEGALGTMIMLTFILYVLPTTGRHVEIDRTTLDYAYQALKTLDQSGILDQSLIASEPNTTQVLVSLDEIMPGNLNYSLRITTLNSSAGTLHPTASEPAYINFTTESLKIGKASLTLNLDNATSPAISITSATTTTPLFETPDIINNSIRLDLTRYITDGENSVTITTSNACDIGYVLNLHEKKSSPYIPADRATASLTYMLAGNTTTYMPTTITLYIWAR